MIHLLPQFYGKLGEDALIHIKDFFMVCALNGGVSDEEIRLRFFPFSLKEKAKEWFYLLLNVLITTWVELAAKFLAKNFQLNKQIEFERKLWECNNSTMSHSMNIGNAFKDFSITPWSTRLVAHAIFLRRIT